MFEVILQTVWQTNGSVFLMPYSGIKKEPDDGKEKFSWALHD